MFSKVYLPTVIRYRQNDNFNPVQIDDKINMAQTLNCIFGRVENVQEGEITGYQNFLLFPQCFQKTSFSESLKVGIVLERVKLRILW